MRQPLLKRDIITTTEKWLILDDNNATAYAGLVASQKPTASMNPTVTATVSPKPVASVPSSGLPVHSTKLSPAVLSVTSSISSANSASQVHSGKMSPMSPGSTGADEELIELIEQFER